MTGLEDDLIEVWADLADSIAEHDVEHEKRAWARLRAMQQRLPEPDEQDCGG